MINFVFLLLYMRRHRFTLYSLFSLSLLSLCLLCLFFCFCLSLPYSQLFIISLPSLSVSILSILSSNSTLTFPSTLFILLICLPIIYFLSSLLVLLYSIYTLPLSIIASYLGPFLFFMDKLRRKTS